jgi:hypothetical protein
MSNISNEGSDIDVLYTEYMRYMDPTEYYFATKVVGSWPQWEEFVKANTSLVSLWRRELEAKIKSMCLSSILETSRGETRDSLQAAKFLLDAPWIKEDTKRGRPSKEDIEMETKQIATDILRVQEDFKRINGTP